MQGGKYIILLSHVSGLRRFLKESWCQTACFCTDWLHTCQMCLAWTTKRRTETPLLFYTNNLVVPLYNIPFHSHHLWGQISPSFQVFGMKDELCSFCKNAVTLQTYFEGTHCRGRKRIVCKGGGSWEISGGFAEVWKMLRITRPGKTGDLLLVQLLEGKSAMSGVAVPQHQLSKLLLLPSGSWE